MIRVIRYLVPIVLFLTAWEVASRLVQARTALCPPPSQCVLALLKWAREEGMVADLLASGNRLIGGLLWGSLAGIAAGLITGRSQFFEAALVPLIRLFRVLPPVALIPLFIVWIGIGEQAKVFAIAFAVFFPVWLNTFSGARQIPQQLIWSMSTLTRSRWKSFLRLILPASLPHTITGLRLGIATAFIMVFVSELMGTDVGVGYKISIWQLAYRMDSMIAALFVLGGAGATLDWLFTRLMFWWFPWLRFVERTPTEASQRAARPVSQVERRSESLRVASDTAKP